MTGSRAAALALLLAAAPAAADTLVIGNKGENSVSFVDLETGRELRRLETGPMPHEVAISPDGARAAVVEYGGNGILLFDIASATRIERIDLGDNRRPHGLLWLRDGRLVATAEGSGTLVSVRVDARGPDRVVAYPTAAEGSHMVAVHEGGSTAYVANMGSGTVSVIDLDGQDDSMEIADAGREPEGIALSADGRRLWVTDRIGNLVRVFDTASLDRIAEFPTGRTPIRVALSPDGREAVVSNFGSGDLTVVDTATMRVARTVPVSGQAGFQQVTILFSRAGDCLYVAETGIDRIAELDWPSGRILGRLPAGRNGDGLGISSVDVTRTRTSQAVASPPIID